MTKQEFEIQWRSGLAVTELPALLVHAEPCDCGEPECEGWQMVPDPARDTAPWWSRSAARRAEK